MVAGVIVWIIISILIVSLSIWDHKRVAKIEQKEREAKEREKEEYERRIKRCQEEWENLSEEEKYIRELVR